MNKFIKLTLISSNLIFMLTLGGCTTILTGFISGDEMYDQMLIDGDSDKNGSISQTEFKAASLKHGDESDAEINSEFKKLDKNGNGIIERAELVTAWKDGSVF